LELVSGLDGEKKIAQTRESEHFGWSSKNWTQREIDDETII